jgi:hypothetical protein
MDPMEPRKLTDAEQRLMTLCRLLDKYTRAEKTAVRRQIEGWRTSAETMTAFELGKVLESDPTVQLFRCRLQAPDGRQRVIVVHGPSSGWAGTDGAFHL